MVLGLARNWIAVSVVQQSNLNKKTAKEDDMRTEENLKGELARLREKRTTLLQQPVQDATSWQTMETIGRRTINVMNQLTEHFPGWKDDQNRVPQFGLVAEQVEKLNPDLVARDADEKNKTVRYEAVNAMLHNEQLLKE